MEQQSVWTRTLSEFREQAGGPHPSPAGVAIASVTASLGLALLGKVLEITNGRKNFRGDRAAVQALLDAARSESTRLMALADDDRQAYDDYREHVRSGDVANIQTAAKRATEVPLEVARAAVGGLDLCAQAKGMITGAILSDREAAESLLRGSSRALLAIIAYNLRELRSDQAFFAAVTTELGDLERRSRAPIYPGAE